MKTLDLKEFVVDLPEERDLAFIDLGRRVSSYFEEVNEYINNKSGIDMAQVELQMMRCATLIEKFAQKHQINIQFAEKSEGSSWRDYMIYLMRKIRIFEKDLAEKQAEEDIDRIIDEMTDPIISTFSSAVLNSEEKAFIHKKISDIRNKIERSGLSESKKRALFAKISKLAYEVDRHGTATDIFMGFALDVSMNLKDIHQNSKPIIEDVKEILKIIYQGRARTEGVELPGPEDLPQLPAPRQE